MRPNESEAGTERQKENDVQQGVRKAPTTADEAKSDARLLSSSRKHRNGQDAERGNKYERNADAERCCVMFYWYKSAPYSTIESMTATTAPTAHHFTVDLEEHFQVSALEPFVTRDDWSTLESRVVQNTELLLDLLSVRGTRATFFILGWVAERQPFLIRQIAAAGHEIASHGWDHRRVTQQEPAAFRESVRASRILLEDLTGQRVFGFRAPSFSIVPGREWALDVLIEEGYLYDSSLFPVRRPGYGYSGGQRDVHSLQRPAGQITEVPPATLRLAGVNLPAAGGAYLRLLPLALVRQAILSCEQRGVPATLYIHPWELDPAQPVLCDSWPTRIRHYGGLERTAPRLSALLTEFDFQPIADTLALGAVA